MCSIYVQDNFPYFITSCGRVCKNNVQYFPCGPYHISKQSHQLLDVVDRLTDWLVDLWTHHQPQTQIWTGHICSREAEMTVRLMKRARERNLEARVCNSYDTTWCDEIWNIVLDSEPAAACIVVIIIIIKINKHINRLQLYWLHGAFLLFAFMTISTTPASFDFRVWS